MNNNILLYIGIDVSKDKHDICIKSNDGDVLKRFQIKNTNKDLNKLYTTVDKLKSNAGENTDVFFGRTQTLSDKKHQQRSQQTLHNSRQIEIERWRKH